MRLKKAGLLTKLLILAMAAYAGFSIMDVRANIADAQGELDRLTTAVEDARRENARLEYEVTHSGDPATLEQIAREKLGLVKPGEKVFYNLE